MAGKGPKVDAEGCACEQNKACGVRVYYCAIEELSQCRSSGNRAEGYLVGDSITVANSTSDGDGGDGCGADGGKLSLTEVTVNGVSESWEVDEVDDKYLYDTYL